MKDEPTSKRASAPAFWWNTLGWKWHQESNDHQGDKGAQCQREEDTA